MTNLPVVHADEGVTAVVDPDTADLVPLSEASDRALAHAAKALAEHDREVLGFKRALAAEARARYGVGKAEAGGYHFTVTESQSWPAGRTREALDALVEEGVILFADAERCMPLKPSPNAVQLRALIGRLTVTHPEAARTLAEACTLSPPSLRDVQESSVDGALAA